MIEEFNELSDFVANEREACVVRLPRRYCVTLDAKNEDSSIIFKEFGSDTSLGIFLMPKN